MKIFRICLSVATFVLMVTCTILSIREVMLLSNLRLLLSSISLDSDNNSKFIRIITETITGKKFDED